MMDDSNNDPEAARRKHPIGLQSTTDSETSSESSYQNEMSSLLMKPLPSPKAIYQNNREKKCIWRIVLTSSILVSVTLVVIGFGQILYDVFGPEGVEHRLVLKYEAIADRSMEYLNSLTVSNTIPKGCETTVLVMRHCEDLGGHVRYQDRTSHCSYLGFQRSLYLATLFGNNHTSNTVARWPEPSLLYGMWNADGTNKRQYELLRPLSDKSGVNIQMFNFEHAAVDLRDDFFRKLSSGEMCNQVAVVVFKHKFIRHLAATLGCDQEKGCPGGDFYAWDDYEFDTVWELQYVYQPEALRAYPHYYSLYMHQYQSFFEGWQVYGSVTRQYFDPLNFKRKYYKGGEKVGQADWMEHGIEGDNNGSD